MLVLPLSCWRVLRNCQGYVYFWFAVTCRGPRSDLILPVARAKVAPDPPHSASPNQSVPEGKRKAERRDNSLSLSLSASKMEPGSQLPLFSMWWPPKSFPKTDTLANILYTKNPTPSFFFPRQPESCDTLRERSKKPSRRPGGLSLEWSFGFGPDLGEPQPPSPPVPLSRSPLVGLAEKEAEGEGNFGN